MVVFYGIGKCRKNAAKVAITIKLDKEQVSALVKGGRLAKGYTQQELADLAKINLRSVQRIENGEVLPRAYTLKLLADALDFSDKITFDSASAKPRLNKAQRVILSTGAALLLIVLSFAFVSQTSRFPETSFELFLFIAAIVLTYGWILFRIWK